MFNMKRILVPDEGQSLSSSELFRMARDGKKTDEQLPVVEPESVATTRAEAEGQFDSGFLGYYEDFLNSAVGPDGEAKPLRNYFGKVEELKEKVRVMVFKGIDMDGKKPVEWSRESKYTVRQLIEMALDVLLKEYPPPIRRRERSFEVVLSPPATGEPVRVPGFVDGVEGRTNAATPRAKKKRESDQVYPQAA